MIEEPKRQWAAYPVAILGFIGCLLLMVLATWVRPETAALGGVVTGAVCVLLAVVVRMAQPVKTDVLDVSVVTFCGYMLWRAQISEVALYARMDSFLVLLVAVFWLMRPYVSLARLSLKRALITLLFILFLANGAASIYQLSTDSQWGLFVHRSEVVQPYASGLFSHYNYFANCCLLSALAALGAIFDNGLKKYWRALSTVTFVGNLILIALSHSRGGFFACAVGLAVFLLLSVLTMQKAVGASRKRPLFFAVVGFVLFLAGAVWVSQLGETRGWFSQNNQLVDNGRLPLSALAVDQFLQAPLIGDGAHSYEWRSIELWPDSLSQSVKTLDYAHNEYFQLLAEYGLVGLALFLFSFGLLLWNLLRRAFYDKEGGKYWAIGAISAVLAYGTHCFFSFTAHVPSLLTLMLVIVIVNLPKPENKGAFQLLGGGLMHRIMLLIAGAGMLMISVPELNAFALYTRYNGTHEKEYEELTSLTADIDAVREVVEGAPNFKRYEDLGVLAAQAYQMSGDTSYLNLAVDSFEQQVKLYPMAPMARVNYARALGWVGRHSEATEHYEYLYQNAKPREYWTNAHWYYAEHCVKLGEDKWFERKSEEALYYFLKSEKLLKMTRTYRFPKDMPRLLKQRIKLLQDAGFEPVKPEEAP